MPGPKGEKCGDCYWWDKHGINGGYCRRLPPAFFISKDSIEPRTTDVCWCGEFKPRDSE